MKLESGFEIRILISKPESWFRNQNHDFKQKIFLISVQSLFTDCCLWLFQQVKGQFWKEFVASAGVFQVGEVFNGDPAYVGPYQNYIDATLNYPFYYTLLDVYGQKKSMKEITGRISQEVGWVRLRE